MATDAWACRDRDELKNDLCRYVTSKCQEETKRRTKKWGRNPRPRAGTLPRRNRGTVYNSCRAEGYRRTKDGRGLVWWRIAGEWWLKKNLQEWKRGQMGRLILSVWVFSPAPWHDVNRKMKTWYWHPASAFPPQPPFLSVSISVSFPPSLSYTQSPGLILLYFLLWFFFLISGNLGSPGSPQWKNIVNL